MEHDGVPLKPAVLFEVVVLVVLVVLCEVVEVVPQEIHGFVTNNINIPEKVNKRISEHFYRSFSEDDLHLSSYPLCVYCYFIFNPNGLTDGRWGGR